MAMRLASHDPDMHRRRSPPARQARAAFDALEQARCEALGCVPHARHDAQNLTACWTTAFPRATSRTSAHATTRPSRTPSPDPARNARRGSSRPRLHASSSISGDGSRRRPAAISAASTASSRTRRLRPGRQRSARPSRMTDALRGRPARTRTTDRNDSDQDQESEGQDGQSEARRRDARRCALRRPRAGDEAARPARRGGRNRPPPRCRRDETGEPRRRAALPPPGRAPRIARPNYKIFTTSFDEIVKAAELCDRGARPAARLSRQAARQPRPAPSRGSPTSCSAG